MRIETYLGTNEDEVKSKEFNIWIGISLGNSYFSKENVKKYIEWAVECTKEDVLVVIADEIRAINYEALNGKSQSRSLKLAKREGDEKEEEVREALSTLPRSVSEKVRIARWGDVNSSKYHQYRLEVLYEEFGMEGDFYEYIVSIIKEARSDRELTKEKLQGLSDYVLLEIPVFLNGVKYKISNENWRTYGLIAYPGISKLDELFIGLQEGSIFPELASRLKITDPIAILEAYID